MRTSICSRARHPQRAVEPEARDVVSPARRYRSPSPSGNERRRCGPPFARAPGSTTRSLTGRHHPGSYLCSRPASLLSVRPAEHHVRTRRLFLKRDEGVRYLESGRRTATARRSASRCTSPSRFKRAQVTVPSRPAGAEESLMKPAGFASTDVTARERHDDGQSFHFMMRGSMPAFLHRDLREG